MGPSRQTNRDNRQPDIVIRAARFVADTTNCEESSVRMIAKEYKIYYSRYT
jgi:hypothetical protein